MISVNKRDDFKKVLYIKVLKLNKSNYFVYCSFCIVGKMKNKVYKIVYKLLMRQLMAAFYELLSKMRVKEYLVLYLYYTG